MMKEAQHKVPPQEQWRDVYMMIGMQRHISDQKYYETSLAHLCKNVYKFLSF